MPYGAFSQGNRVHLTSAISLSSGMVTLSSVPTVTATAGTNPWSSAPSFNMPMVSASSGFMTSVAFGSETTSRLIVLTTVGKVSSAPGYLHMLGGLSTSLLVTGYIRVYDHTTDNATSSSNAGLAGAVMLLPAGSGEPVVFRPAIKFATACSVDFVVSATSTATQIGGWVSAQYTPA